MTQYKKDWHEGIGMHAPINPEDYYAPVGPDHTLHKRGAKVLTGSNPYPLNPQGFQEAVEAYVDIMKHLGMATMRAIAMGLGLDEHFFDDKMDNGFWVLRLIGYPPLSTNTDNSEGGISCGQHTDYGCLTILNTDDTPDALQVLSKSGEWITANPIPGAFVINIGDMLNIWTNNRYTATLHRVIHGGQNYRVSIPFFFEPNFDTIVAPIPGIGDGQDRYSSVMYGDHLLGKVSNNFQL